MLLKLNVFVPNEVWYEVTSLSVAVLYRNNEDSLWRTSCLVYNLPMFRLDTLVILRAKSEARCENDGNL